MWISSTENNRWSVDNSYSDKAGDTLIVTEEAGKELYGFGCCMS